MPGYSRDIARYECIRCTSTATREVFNGRNELVGYFCARHAEEQVARMNEASS